MAVAIVSVLAFAAAGCSDDDDSDTTMPLDEWVEEFDAVCMQVIEDISESPDDFETISDAGVAEMQALPQPDEMADTAAELLDAIGSDQDPDLTQQQIDAIEERLLDAFTKLGISDACIRGVPG